MTITEQNQLVDAAIASLRRLGYAVVAFAPEELGSCPTEDLEDYLTEHGWERIAMSDVAT